MVISIFTGKGKTCSWASGKVVCSEVLQCLSVLQKLRLFVGDTGNLMPVDRGLEDIMTDEFGVYSGSSLILETVPHNLTFLPDLHKYTTAS